MRFVASVVIQPAGNGPAQIKTHQKEIGAGFETMAHSAKKFEAAFDFGHLITGLAAQAAGILALHSLIHGAIEEVGQGEKAFAQLSAAVASTGGRAGYTAVQLDELAHGYQLLTGVQDDVVSSAMVVLLEFEHLSGSAIPRATQASLDLAARLGIDVPAAARKLGLALEGNFKSLQKAGIIFDDEGKKQLKTLFDTGRYAEAQAIIFKKVEQAVGGAAAAYRNTLPGAIQATKSAWADVLEEIGKGAAPELVAFADELRHALEDPEFLAEAKSLGEGIGKAFKVAGEGVVFLVQHWEALKLLGMAYIGLNLPGYFLSLTKAIEALTIASKASALANPLAWVVVGLLWLNQAVTDFKRLAEADIALNVQLGNQVGQVGLLREEYGKLTLAQVESAKAALDAFSIRGKALEAENAQIDRQIAALERQRTGGPDRSPRITDPAYQGMGSADAVRAIQRAESDLLQTRSENAQELKNVNNITAGMTERLKEHEKHLAATGAETHTLTDKQKALAEKLKELNALFAEDARWQKELQALYGKGPGQDLADRLKTELQINDAHEDRLAFLKYQKEFGDKIAAGLVEQLKTQREQRRETELLKIASQKLAPIAASSTVADLFAASKKGLDELTRYLEAFDRALQKVEADNAAAFQSTFGAEEAEIQALGASIVASFHTTAENANHEIELIGKALLTVEEKERAIAEVRVRQLDTFLGQWAQFFSFLGDRFGGVFSKIASAIGQIQQAIQALQAVQAASGGLNAAGLAGVGKLVSVYASYVAYAFLAFVAYKIVEGFAASRTKYGEASIGQPGGTPSQTGNREYSARAAEAIQELVKQVTGLAQEWHLGLVSLTAASVTIGRNSDHEFVVRGMFDSVGTAFKDMNGAMDYARVLALKFAQYSEETASIVKGILRASAAKTTAELQGQVELGQTLATQNLSSEALRLTEALQLARDQMAQLKDIMAQAGRQGFPEFGEGVASIVTRLVTSIRQEFNSLEGIKPDPAEEQRQREADYNTRRAMAYAQLLTWKAEIAAMQASHQAHVAFVGSVGGMTRGILGFGEIMLKGGGIFMGEVDAIAQGLAAAAAAIDAALDSLPPAVVPGSTKPHRQGGGAGIDRAAAHQTALDRLDDLRAASAGQVAQEMLQYTRAIRELEKVFKDGRMSGAQLAEAERLLAEQRTANLRATAEGLAGIRTDTLAAKLREVEKFFADLAAQGAASGISGADQDDLRRRARTRLAEDAIGSLGLPTETTANSIKALGETLAFLRARVDDGSISAERFGEVMLGLQRRSENELLGMAQGILESMGQTEEAATLKAALDEANFEIQVAQLNILYESFRAAGLLGEAALAALEHALGIINDPANRPSFKPVVEPTVRATTAFDSASTAFSDAVAQFKSATDSLVSSFRSIYGSTTLGGSAQDVLAFQQSQFQGVEAAALAGDLTARGQFGALAESYLSALNTANVGGALFAAERARLYHEFETLFAQTTFTTGGVGFGPGTGITPTPIPNVFVPQGTGTPSQGSSGNLDNSAIVSAIGALQQGIQGAIVATANNTRTNSQDTAALIAEIERLLARLRQGA